METHYLKTAAVIEPASHHCEHIPFRHVEGHDTANCSGVRQAGTLFHHATQ